MDAGVLVGDPEAEAWRILEAAQADSVLVRLLGGLAVRLHCPSAQSGPLRRQPKDIDLVTAPREEPRVEQLMGRLGYEPNRRFNMMNETRRMYLLPNGARQIDVFLGEFRMCHRLPLVERLPLDPHTVPLAELLLTKLQIVAMNEKDVQDISAVLLDHPVSNRDEDSINAEYLSRVCGMDWGLYYTAYQNLAKVADLVEAFPLTPAEKSTVRLRAEQLRGAMAAAPKTLRWRLRALVGPRLTWYELPEEVYR